MDFVIPEEEIRRQAVKDGITHLATGIAVIKNGKVLVVRRAAHEYLGGWYELHGGGIEEGETFAQGVARETLEETGLTVKRIVGMFDGFDYTTDKKPRARQLNFVVQVEPGEVTLNPDEHDDYQWIGPEAIDNLHTTKSIKVCLHTLFDQISTQPK